MLLVFIVSGTYTDKIYISECARDQYDYMETKLIGRMFRCAANGNYKKVQCMGSVCYCTDMLGQQQGNSTVFIGDMDKLNC